MTRTTKRRLLALPALALILASLNCSVNIGGTDVSPGQTQTAIAAQQTALASGMNATITMQQATINAVSVQATTQAGQPTIPPTPNLAATQLARPTQIISVSGGGLSAATSAPEATAPPVPATELPAPAATLSPDDLQAKMKTANILVYEDIVTDPTEFQYVKRTLDAMGLQYTWDGNAIGHLKSHMLGGAPNGKPWDLVILAIESRDDVSGEFFDYLNDLLNQGTSVIIEAFHLDDVSEGAISPILSRCGVTVYPYVPETGTTVDAVIWPLQGSSDSPILHNPNSGLNFTAARDKWFFSFDLGSKMALTGTGDAQLLLGTNAQDSNQDGVLATCMGGQFTLQTFSSHTFTYDIMQPLWQNYIQNALKVRLSGG